MIIEKLELPYPPSNNSLYIISKTKKWSETKKKFYYPRILTTEAKNYKKYVAELIFYSFPKVKFGENPIQIDIIVHPPDDKRKRDIHNGEKVLFDAIKLSGIIKDDDQIVKRSSVISNKIDRGKWILTIRPYKQENNHES